jgi:hypothetical protein
MMARANAWQRIVRDDADRRLLIDGLEQAVVRHVWELLVPALAGAADHPLTIAGPEVKPVGGTSSVVRTDSSAGSGIPVSAGVIWKRAGQGRGSEAGLSGRTRSGLPCLEATNLFRALPASKRRRSM